MNVKCEICGKEYKNNKGLSTHIRYKHNIDSKTYYDKYLKSKKEGICPVCGKETPFLKLSKGYQICCSLSCGTINSRDKARRTSEVRYGNPYYNNRDKYNKTINDKYGVDNISQSKEIKEKKKQTSLNHYGVDNPAKADEVKNKTKQSNLDKYGYEHTLQVPEIREKGIKTLMDNYGVEHPLQNKEIKKKQEQTCKNRFGVYNAFASNDIRKQIEANNIIKYGVKNVSQVSEIREKAKQTMEQIYGVKYPLQSDEIKERIRETNIDKYGTEHPNQNKDVMRSIIETRRHNQEQYAILNNCIPTQQLLNIYGTGWHQSKLGRNIEFIYNGISFVHIEDIPKIEEYANKSHKSNYENEILQFLKTNYNGYIIEHSRSVIPPLELDFYLPDIEIAIEFNGVYWHSIEHGIEKDYHLNKSILCRNKNIRLIHLYEFEDFEEQLNLLKELLSGNDLYNSMDFNKNNLIDTIPKPKLIYNKDYTIYGAGKLY